MGNEIGSDQGFILEAKEFQAVLGQGVSGIVLDKEILVGNRRPMLSLDINLTPEVEEHLIETEQLARMCVLVAIDKKVEGAFVVPDPMTLEAKIVVSILKSMFITSIMVIGDNWGTCSAISKEVGIEMVFSETKPLRKSERVKELHVFILLLLVYFHLQLIFT